MTRGFRAPLVALPLVLLPGTTRAQTPEWTPPPQGPVVQFNASIVAGLRAYGSGEAKDHNRGVVGFRPELIFGRRSDRSIGAGPYVEVGWLGVSNVAGGGGGTLLLPLSDRLALSPSIGAFAHDSREGARIGYTGGFFLGRLFFNPISSFEGTAGIRLDWRSDIGSSPDRALVISAQLDLTLPVAAGSFL